MKQQGENRCPGAAGSFATITTRLCDLELVT